ncbi:MAG: ABC transporter ATP-binding protein [Gammaproteobacteria bacterium]|nr:ABC transporter ATP-binding protein [Gammaproteobacteria bacterium]
MSMISIKGLSKAYGTVDTSLLIVLKNINVTINEGEFVAIMGPSGSGKSTLLNVIGMLDDFEAGEYLFKGENVTKLSSNVLAELRLYNIGFVFQSFNLIPQLSAQTNVELPTLYTNTKKSIRQNAAVAQLTALGLGNRLSHKPSELSGGQQQRVAIARAMVNDPPLLVADEPTGSLDSATSHDIMQLFQTLHQRGKTIVMVTHEEDIAKCAQRIIRMHDGKIIDHGVCA